MDWKLSSETKKAWIKTEYTSATTATVTHAGPDSTGGNTESPLSYTKSYTDFTTIDATWGKELSNTTLGQSTDVPLVSQWSYYTTTSTADGSFARSLKTEIDPAGTWKKYEYYATDSSSGPAGSIKRIYRPWLDGPASPDEAHADNSVTEDWTYYSNGTNYYWNLPASVTAKAPNGATLSQTTWTYNLNAGTMNTHAVYSAQQKDYWKSGTSDCLTTTRKNFRWDIAAVALREKPVSVIYPDGRAESWAYFNGTWNESTRQFTASADGPARQVLRFHGQTLGGTHVTTWSQNGQSRTIEPLYLVSGLSTVSEQVTDEKGRTVFAGTLVYTASGTLERVAGVLYNYDTHGRLIEEVDVVRSVGAASPYKTSRTYVGSLITSETSPDGVMTTYEYDGLLRLTKKTIGAGGAAPYPAKVEEFSYDGAGRVVKAHACSCPTGATLYTYDAAGRLESKSESSPNGGDLTTSYEYTSPREAIVTDPSGATRITEIYLDGKTKSETGTARTPVYFSYAVNATGLKVTTTHGSATDKSWGWTETQSDWLGRTTTVEKPYSGWDAGSAPNNSLVYEYAYNSKGQLSSERVKQKDASVYLTASRLYVYDYGWLQMEGLDIDNNGSLTKDSNDRIVTHDWQYVKDSHGWLHQTVRTGYLTENSSTGTVISTVETRLTGFNNGALLDGNIVYAETTATDAAGLTTTMIEYVNPAAKARTRQTTHAGATQPAYQEFVNGYAALTQSPSDVVQKYTYDALGRLEHVYGRKAGGDYQTSVSYTYYGNTPFVNTQTGGGVSVQYAYAWGTDGSRTVSATQDGHTQHTRYNARGLVHRVWGGGARPVEYGYDIHGRTLSLTTWRDGAFSGSSWPASPAGARLRSGTSSRRPDFC